MPTPMLCATVTATTMAELLERRDAVDGADLVELRLDGVRDVDVARRAGRAPVAGHRDLPGGLAGRSIRRRRGDPDRDAGAGLGSRRRVRRRRGRRRRCAAAPGRRPTNRPLLPRLRGRRGRGARPPVAPAGLGGRGGEAGGDGDAPQRSRRSRGARPWRCRADGDPGDGRGRNPVAGARRADGRLLDLRRRRRRPRAAVAGPHARRVPGPGDRPDDADLRRAGPSGQPLAVAGDAQRRVRAPPDSTPSTCRWRRRTSPTSRSSRRPSTSPASR